MSTDFAAMLLEIWKFLIDDRAANLATALGVPFALYGGWIALEAYRSDKRIAASAHMHSLFQGYLNDAVAEERALREIEKDAQKQEARTELIAELMAGLRLYALEEMFVWIKDQERRPRFWFLNLTYTRRQQFKDDALNSWRATIREHLKRDASKLKRDIEGYATCYSVEFLELIAEVLSEDAKVDQLAQRHRVALDGIRARPPGKMEQMSATERDSHRPSGNEQGV